MNVLFPNFINFVTEPKAVPKERKNHVECPLDAESNRRLAG